VYVGAGGAVMGRSPFIEFISISNEAKDFWIQVGWMKMRWGTRGQGEERLVFVVLNAWLQLYSLNKYKR
jgi:hypothetical protein